MPLVKKKIKTLQRKLAEQLDKALGDAGYPSVILDDDTEKILYG